MSLNLKGFSRQSFRSREASRCRKWLINTIDLSKAARILDESQVELAKIQLKDVDKTWWLAEEARLDKAIT